MCFRISPDNFLVNYFANSSKQSASYAELSAFKRSIEKSLDDSVYIIFDRDAIAVTLRYNGDLFREKDDSIQFIKKAFIGRDIKDFNVFIPSRIRTNYVNAFRAS